MLTDTEKLNRLKLLTSDVKVSDERLELYLSMAEQKILGRCYPMVDTSALRPDGSPKYKMPAKYDALQIELATRYVSRMGIEGQTSSNEAGISRVFGSANDEDLLSEVMQIITTR